MIYQQSATPFVCEFIGKVNKISVRRKDGMLLAGKLRLDVDPWGSANEGTAVAYIRPEHLTLSNAPAHEGWPATLQHVYLSGSIARLELQVNDVGQVLEAEISGEDALRLALRAGTQWMVQPRVLTMFPLNAGGEPEIAGRRMVRPKFGER